MAAYGAALALTAGMAAIRIMAGGHFVSDTIFAGVFTFLIIWLAHALIYRWPRTRFTDERSSARLSGSRGPVGQEIVNGDAVRQTKSPAGSVCGEQS